MTEYLKAKALDSLRTHFTTVGEEYNVVDQDSECYKIVDNRGKHNWIPKRYMELIKKEEE